MCMYVYVYVYVYVEVYVCVCVCVWVCVCVCVCVVWVVGGVLNNQLIEFISLLTWNETIKIKHSDN